MTERCSCFACSDCRPEVAAAADAIGMPFLKVLVIVTQAEQNTLARLVDLHTPKLPRPARRRQERDLAKIREKRDKVRRRVRVAQ